MAGAGLVVSSEWTPALDRSWRAFRLDYHGLVIGEVHAARRRRIGRRSPELAGGRFGGRFGKGRAALSRRCR
ncbi:hypothetical protein HPB50_020318 [Hyalomma asiaticum]|uniref:Uncharacterized protein n=1 Tax=Hyalomma asiaticum TaxID=266040 RepID=A0ACB7RMQ8_HYAAI|nr:hypothetical protein HPB50_020318 [Hyalomma asiaticum]